jgi:hypothetical protein
MDRRIVLAGAGVVAVTVAVWLMTRPDDSAPATQHEPRDISAHEVTTEAEAATAVTVPANAHRTSPGPAASAAPAAATQPVAAMQPAAARSPAAAGDTLPIDVSPGFEFLSKPATEMEDTDFMWPNWRRHQQLQGEVRDETWAPRMESALRTGIADALTARGLDTQRIELPVVECRTTGCEIQALGYAEDQRQRVDLQFIVPALLRESLANEFETQRVRVTMMGRPDQRVGYLVLLSRKQN